MHSVQLTPQNHATLQALGYGWLDFIRSIVVITLFGRGFGGPIEFDGMYPNWRSLPTREYYLAASVSDLKKITNESSNEWASLLISVQGLLWHCPGDLVAPCPCQGRGVRQMICGAFRGPHIDPVQVFWPRMSRLIRPAIRGPARLEDGGAIAFGHNIAWKYHWRENGHEDLEEGDPPSLPVPQHITAAHTGSSSGSPNRGAGLSIASRSSQSYESTARAMTRRSPSITINLFDTFNFRGTNRRFGAGSHSCRV